MSSQRRPEMSPAARNNDNGYVETDPTGRYGRLDELLGKGAMKSVYRGFDEVRGVEVAWNQANLADVLRTPDALQRMYSEVHLLSTLRHDSIIAFHASWVSVSSPSPRAGCAPRRTFNFITELFSSGTLRAYRLRYPRVSLRAVRGWARQILRGLAYLHAHDPPVIHRDLKCDNVFVNGHQGTVKIGDLGLAAVLRGAQAAHSVIGTPEFMAPEMYDEDYDELVDVYSFGMCMLEMLTVEYPYAECSNPAQIYKKVTSGKLPDAFYRVDDADARRFIGRCLVPASHRPSAQELLLDPFLSTQDTTMTLSPPPLLPALPASGDQKDSPDKAEPVAAMTDMTITGKLNTDDDTIFLKVQIVDEAGHSRNIYFPFDIAGDTATEVAREMVKELDITDRDPSEIAAMIEEEIMRLVPDWVGGGCDDQQEYYTYADNDDNEEQPPFYYLSSSPTSSNGSHSGVGPTTSGGWFQDYAVSSDDDETSSTRSALHYSSEEAQPEEKPGVSKTGQVKATRFGPGDIGPGGGHDVSSSSSRADRPRHHRGSPDAGGEEGRPRRQQGRMTRNRSMVDVRSQLLHRTLVEELNKRMFFNTVGAVENIGFRRIPGYGGGPSSSSATVSSSRGGDQRGRRGGKDKHQFFMF
ncbi:probable serine/threonine-protein kinase WNK8 [Hordeum vulgare subsp. vulgare]|uniref:non-specific serine/threonine protein kinase n=1 Tax=Hordeum vulgare subsp. vulgare TaxID=112509 RepID=A0A8I7B8P8_HORVV|nr:probable serine/threonine-protein kinase WNK8 [Hordeum vulgare subsp. vulgare]